MPILDGGDDCECVGSNVHQGADGNNEDGAEFGAKKTWDADGLAEHEERNDHLQEDANAEEETG